MPAEKKHNHNNNISSTHNTSNDIEKKQEAEQEEGKETHSANYSFYLFQVPIMCAAKFDS